MITEKEKEEIRAGLRKMLKALDEPVIEEALEVPDNEVARLLHRLSL